MVWNHPLFSKILAKHAYFSHFQAPKMVANQLYTVILVLFVIEQSGHTGN